MKLILRTKSKEGKHPLYFKMNVEGKVCWFNLCISVDVTEWNEANLSDRKLTNYLAKKGIGKKVALIEDAIADMRRHHRLTKVNLDAAIESIVLADKREELKRAEALKNHFERKKNRSIDNFLVKYVEGIENGEVRTVKKEKHSKNSCKNWKQFKKVFLEFYKTAPFEWEDINEFLIDRYIAYLEACGYMKETISKHISQFKTLVGVAERQGLHTNHIAFNLLRKPQVKDDDKGKKIYLTNDELSALYKMPLDGFYEQVRDVFLIGCFTAMRFSDYGSIEKSDIGITSNGTNVIRITQEKTGGKVVIPIVDDRLDALLKKYDYCVPRIWDQSLNRAIKQICKMLSETVPSLAKKERTNLTLKERNAEIEARKMGKELYEYDEQGYPLKPRWELVASHTARRSCITNMYLSKKFSVSQMMSISGHTSEAMFNKYVKLSLDEKAETIASSACGGLF